MSRNLQFTRRRLKLSQKQFVDNFLSDANGEALLSVPKLSNLENKGGNKSDQSYEEVLPRSHRVFCRTTEG